MTVNSYYQEWSKLQTWESSTVKAMNLAVKPVSFGDVAFADFGKLLENADDHFTAPVALCGFAGMRLGEPAALRVGDNKFLAKEMRIERRVQRANGGAVKIRPPKYESVRTVYAPDELLHILSEHVCWHLPDNSPDQWMFPGEGEHRLHDVVTAQRAPGHSSPSVTLNTYAHLWPNANDRTRKAVPGGA